MNVRAALVTLVPLPALAWILYSGLPAVWAPSQLAGVLLLLPSAFLLTLARLQLGSAFSVAPRASVLVTRGLYKRIRNPVYLFGLSTFAGLLLYLGRPWFLVFLLPVAALQIVRAGREAKVLEERFGGTYRAYRAQTWI